MNLSTIFSKTGKGLQETSGKTSHLSRADRSVLTAIDGKLTVAELARRVGKTSDRKFQQLVESLENQGFIREVAPAPSPVSAPRPPSVITPRAPASKPASDAAGGDDLDFTQAFQVPRRPAAPSKPIDLAAKVHETAAPGGAAFDYRARAEAEARAKSEIEKKAKAEAEARAKAIAEAKAKAEAEAKAREAEQAKAWTRELAEAEAKAARDAIARAEAEEARARKEAEDRKRREEEERKAKIEAERRAEEERKAREEAERKAKIEAERRAKEEAERRAKEEAERKRREEEERKRREEDERRRKEEEERKRREEEARRRKEEEERKRREEEERKRREEEERQRREAEERARREQEERERKEKEERRRREEEERKRVEAEERARREEEEQRRRKEEERRRRREEEDRRRAEEDERRRLEDEEIRLREDQARELEERPIREAEERQRREEDERRAEEDERRRLEDQARELEDRTRKEEEALREKEEALRRKEEELARKEAEIRRAEEERASREEQARPKREPEPEARPLASSFDGLLDDLDFVDKKPEAPAKREAPAKTSLGSFADRLLADLDLFGKKDEEEERRKDEEARLAKEEAIARKGREKDEKRRREEEARRARQEAREREEAERERRRDEEQRAREQAERDAQEAAERQVREEKERKDRERAERRAREKLERRRKAAAPSKPLPETDDLVITDEDLGMDDVQRDEALLTPEAREAARERAREDRRRRKEGAAPPPPKFRRPIKWGRPLTIMLLAGLVVGLVAIHIVPMAQEPYERLASKTLGQPVRIGSARMSLVNGLEILFENVRVGDGFQAQVVRAAPELAWLLGENTGFRRVDIGHGMLAQGSLARVLLGNLADGGLRVQRITAKGLRVEGPVPVPALDVDLQLTANGTLRLGTLSGADNLQVKLGRLGSDITIEATADRLAVPVLPALMLGDFAMKATASATGMNIAQWDGRLYDGVVKGSARVQWHNGWIVQGDLRIVEMNGGIFAPAMLSAGKVEATGRFTLAGPNPGKLGDRARLEGKLAVSKGVLGSVDMSRAIQSGGRHVVGRTQFNELSADAIYDSGAVALRNIVISAGALSGSGRVDIAPDGRLGGRIIAEVRTPSQQLRSVLDLSGTAREPQTTASN